MSGQCNYAFIVILKNPNWELRDKIEGVLDDNKIEFRRGLSGGGNQMRQPYFENHNFNFDDFSVVEHIHNFSWYIGNYPTLERQKLDNLIRVLNEV